MRREQLLRLIEAATPEQLRQVARLVLRLSGYAASRISDEPHDGGSDLRVHDVDGAPLPLAIAVSVEQGWQRKLAELRALLAAELVAARLPATDEVVELTLRGLGALMLRHVGAPDALDDLRAQTRLLRRALQAHGLPEGARGDQVVAQLLEVARASPLGRSLATGSLYRTLCTCLARHREALLGALDVRSMALVLDASVAIPMLCSLFHGEVRQRFFVVAHELHRQAQRHRFPLQLPTVWLEEMASHLLKARFYRGLGSTGEVVPAACVCWTAGRASPSTSTWRRRRPTIVATTPAFTRCCCGAWWSTGSALWAASPRAYFAGRARPRRATAERMIAAAIQVAGPTVSPARAEPRTMATIGLT